MSQQGFPAMDENPFANNGDPYGTGSGGFDTNGARPALPGQGQEGQSNGQQQFSDAGNQGAGVGNPVGSTKQEDTGAEKKPQGEGGNVAYTGSRQYDDRGKIFVGGLSWETTTETLTNHFAKYGELSDAVIMKDRATGHPRGFGFVTYADPSICDIALQDAHVIDGRTVEAKRSVPREPGSGGGQARGGGGYQSRGGDGGAGMKTRKIFAGGLPSHLTEDEFRAYFEKFGKVEEALIMLDHHTGRSRGFGFVTFETEEGVEAAVSIGRMHDIGGKQVEVKKAEPRREGGGSGGYFDKSGGYGAVRGGYGGGGGYGSGYGSGGGYGEGYGGYRSGGGSGYGGRGSAGYGAAGYGSSGYGAAASGYGTGLAGYGASGYGSGMSAYGGVGGYGTAGLSSYGSGGYGAAGMAGGYGSTDTAEGYGAAAGYGTATGGYGGAGYGTAAGGGYGGYGSPGGATGYGSAGTGYGAAGGTGSSGYGSGAAGGRGGAAAGGYASNGGRYHPYGR